ncbi:hypothetical protein J2T50_001382 [Streptococcus gallinaceus]|uniref:hypothetical protein n=1 Tax=Streptococcus gallinaceus TaxID=165758 RepID=UPI00209F7B83|nr:hypothetical protein [Streptococcus gallinaceus]MCP1639673.1 hypothetical protein [Streptococcus gallinaceus]MCP1770456.1 hypothetical protein [Streptococcus gallinaceus]
MQELNLTPSQAIFFFIVLIRLVIYQWHKMSRISYQIKLEDEEDTNKLKNEHYGAIIQLTGKYYN